MNRSCKLRGTCVSSDRGEFPPKPSRPGLRRFLRRIAAALAVIFLPAAAAADSLPSLNIDLAQTSVSGLSSGGFMAVQFHVAFSSIVKGAGVIAGGPYFCALDDQTTATSACSCTGFGACQPGAVSASLPVLIDATDTNAANGTVDPPSHLVQSRIWLFSGRLDSVVPTPVMDALQAYYAHYGAAANLAFRKDIAAEHAMPTESFGNPCAVKGDPFINDCAFDAAGELLQWIHGPLNPRNTGSLGGSFVAFDQGEFISAPQSHGMWGTGFAYIPASCAGGALCRVHVVFHGCRQFPGYPYPAGPSGKFGDTYARNTGYNSWADTNNIVVLYPQANAMTMGTRPPRINPFGCWDWWGYDDVNYANRNGRQMAAVRAMLARLAGGPGPAPAPSPPPAPPCVSATNNEHAGAGRAYLRSFVLYFATGSNNFLGFSGLTRTSLKETSAGRYERVASCS